MMRKKQALELRKEQQKFGGFGTNVKGIMLGTRAKSATALARKSAKRAGRKQQLEDLNQNEEYEHPTGGLLPEFANQRYLIKAGGGSSDQLDAAK